ncbi:MAG: phosphoribosylformimino-5-aminoimidazole carboxamide ribotide isomerase [Lachnospiraceae bacterium]|uniref:phosphoribosylformimino-5-aminoimidazole carboxamide ribotide isomerase n=1 Tax=Roseburia hominis TaxID=301301 RepID=UPI001F3720C8|nr:phosphoribosylformimino-5-aminoimidazole carboxamide ribotide isomerase [Roseburia hominis]MDD6168487.1 phosphoribosylformimino-5-aminoimidazole carboxamide ribotide isomerase [Lachnospiraceae bacterium]MDY4840505.1 phosphoribosylformimino-5-aminoimidazole carboxamide ribotide isomerase [Lachnospiraceae bacterium]
MEFRPCIDIHNGKVKQIVGSTLADQGDLAEENFVSTQDAAFYADFYKKDNIRGGHVILLNGKDSAYYNETKEQALLALKTYPGGLQVGGGITDANAREFLDAGASHVIVTSYVFKEGKIHYGNLKKLVKETGREHLVLDISCRKRGDTYYVVTDRWQKFTDEPVTEELLEELSSYASEFLVHAVDVEGKANGVEKELIQLLGDWGKIPVTYAGGVHSFDDIKTIKELGKNHLNVTIGSALDLFGGTLSYKEVIDYVKKN